MIWLEQLASGSDGTNIVFILAVPIAAALILIILATAGGSQHKQYKRRVNRVRGEDQTLAASSLPRRSAVSASKRNAYAQHFGSAPVNIHSPAARDWREKVNSATPATRQYHGTSSALQSSVTA